MQVISHLLASLLGGKVFAKLDLAQAYQQLPVTEEAAEAQIIEMHRGACVRRLQFGVSVAPGVFQYLMETMLRGIPGVVLYFGDTILVGALYEELAHRLHEVLSRFQEVGLRVNKDKCNLGADRVEFLRFLIDAEGVHPTPSKTRAIINMPHLANKAKLQAFLGLVNFYHAFLPHTETIAEPLHRLLDKHATWVWGREQQNAFVGAKQLLESN